MPHQVCHFEIPADDVARAIEFYKNLFGWQINETMEGYHLIQTGENEVGGGLMKRVVPEHRPVIYFQVESVDDYIRKIQQLGGTVVVPKMAVPTMGYWAQAMDTEGNVFAIWQNDPQAK
jgi:predicted enzyme related to lactoylglutathione lyase